MDCMEECLLSDSDDDEIDSYDPYESDPKFESKEELENFISNCDISSIGDIGGRDIDYELHIGIKKKSACGQSEDISSGDFKHICCHQADR